MNSSRFISEECNYNKWLEIILCLILPMTLPPPPLKKRKRKLATNQNLILFGLEIWHPLEIGHISKL